MASVTQLVPNLLGGVSKQPDDKKIPGQVREAINAYADPTYGLSKRPGTKWLGNLSSTTNEFQNGKWFYINRDEAEKYIGVIYGANIKIWNINNPTATVTVTNSGSSYLTYGSSNAKDSLQVLTVQDTTIVVNNKVTVTTLAAPSYTLKSRATLRLLSAEYGAEYKVTINGTTSTFTTKNSEDPALSNTTTTKVLSADQVLDTIYNNVNAIKPAGSTVTKLKGTIEISGATSAFTIEASGGISGEELLVFQDEVQNFSNLPAESLQGRIVKINNTVAKEDSYYAVFNAENGTSGKGNWQETVAPNVSKGLTASTMPHELVNTALNTFELRPITWEERLVGDDETNEHPSFVGKTIQQVFFHNNRLGFLTGDNVSMSQSGEFYNFYHVSALTQADNDPIDISCSSLRPAVLHSVLPAAQGLVLFSKSQQFLMYSDDGILTPKTSVIRTIANYENEELIPPVDVGTNMVFLSKSPGYTRIYAMATRGQQENPDVLDVGRIVSEWVPDSVEDLVASPQNSFFAMYGPTSEYLYFFRTYVVGEETAMQTWFNWKMHGNVQFFGVDSDDTYVVTYQSGQYVLSKANLTQTPDEAILRADSGQVVQLCLDQYATPSSVSYDSATKTNRCYLRYKDITGLEPAVIIADPNNTGESGFTVTPARGNDGNPYFEFVGDDYSGLASTVYVGFKYDFDVQLPTIFYQIGENRSDYTANLTISRVKFSVGLSSNVGFKLKAKGQSEWYDVQSIQDADYYLANDVPLNEQTVYTLPIHQRNSNFDLKVFSDSPFPISLTSMMWEGSYSPRFYRRA
ncbi:tail tubular protein B [Synechococcus phage S-CBP3]|uniref:Tail tubular protein B n=2 Tax=Synechococcus phage S-CBP3 TaxID=756276 RepID=I3ULX0_9CAUD|nr:tail protein [Synechococcus phage S-CBP3]YP_009822266.1 tail protein [Synechococcus phage S-CBP3]AFK66485.1 tail tubular protein B [Synechococcus phage S-CBP3]AGK86604.1 tail tubular protein B [Synechococcus phage S-CBP3]